MVNSGDRLGRLNVYRNDEEANVVVLVCWVCASYTWNVKRFDTSDTRRCVRAGMPMYWYVCIAYSVQCIRMRRWASTSCMPSIDVWIMWIFELSFAVAHVKQMNDFLKGKWNWILQLEILRIVVDRIPAEWRNIHFRCSFAITLPNCSYLHTRQTLKQSIKSHFYRMFWLCYSSSSSLRAWMACLVVIMKLIFSHRGLMHVCGVCFFCRFMQNDYALQNNWAVCVSHAIASFSFEREFFFLRFLQLYTRVMTKWHAFANIWQ